MFYALRRGAGSDRHTLVEFVGKRAFQNASASGENKFSIVRSDAARISIKLRKEHETGLFIDEGRVRYAPSGR
ncbi:hypothetical protein [Rhizobium sp. BE258]|jgi:hypothetical protein|uniref:hypothetical protein n=1 Tax=Rhizobium sp. BE258 TaxID=2817722 RepID=UPI002855B8B1|nr:hypothetical protein [Rhizobium sp. BE258]MDR7143885.1 hypothetical protein [Rhizobium sp. BE258]